MDAGRSTTGGGPRSGRTLRVGAVKIVLALGVGSLTGCGAGSGLAVSSSVTPSAGSPTTATTFSAVGPLDGTYQMTLTEGELRAGTRDPTEVVIDNYGHFVLVISRGRFAFTQHEAASCTWGYGKFSVAGARLQMFFIDGGGHSVTGAVNRPGELFSYTWTRFHGALKWDAVAGAVSPTEWRLRPWSVVSTSASVSALDANCRPPANALTG